MMARQTQGNCPVKRQIHSTPMQALCFILTKDRSGQTIGNPVRDSLELFKQYEKN
jgi:hypothetical protein